MRHKILIADDSLTIQKVIKITLANEPFDLDICQNSDEIATKLQTFNPNIVLLDFNLSQDKTGYELCKKIKLLSKSVKIFMLFGTFDTIDEAELEEVGCDNKIVKPFDGTKFINICRSLADLSSIKKVEDDEDDEDASFENTSSFEEDALETVESVDEEENWVMDAPDLSEETTLTTETSTTTEDEKSDKTQLVKDIEDWGMSVPGVIGEEDPQEFPEVIQMTDHKEVSASDMNLPAEDDLEYPDLDAAQSENFEIETNEGPKLTPMSDLNLEEDSSDSSGFNEIDFDAPAEGTNTEEELERIQAQIADEVDTSLEEVHFSVKDEADLWSYDEVEDSSNEDLPAISPHKLEEVIEEDDSHHTKEEVEYEPDFLVKGVNEDSNNESIDFSVDKDFEAKMKEHLRPLVEEYVKQYSKTMIEKVAWEVIPDLAENLIKKEIEKIANSVIEP